MIAVADSLTLAYMIDAGAIQYLQDYYQQVLVTPQTLDELKNPKQSQEVQEWANTVPSRENSLASWVQVVEPKQKDWMNTLPDATASRILHLSDEQTEMMGVAFERKADTVLSDDRDTREYIDHIRERGLTKAHALGVMVSMAMMRGDGYDPNAGTLAKLGNRFALSLPFLKNHGDALAHKVDIERRRIAQHQKQQETQQEKQQQQEEQSQEQ